MLTMREFAVAEHYAAGLSYKEIARELGISPATIRNHIAAIYRKLEINNKAQLIHRLPGFTHEAMPARRFAPGTLAAPVLQRLDTANLDSVSNPSVAVLPFKNIGAADRDFSFMA